MRAVRLGAWNEKERLVRFAELKRLGFQVAYKPMDAGALLRSLEEERPSALVIDLSRSPALGRDVGVAVRVRASNRPIPGRFSGYPWPPSRGGHAD